MVLVILDSQCEWIARNHHPVALNERLIIIEQVFGKCKVLKLPVVSACPLRDKNRNVVLNLRPEIYVVLHIKDKSWYAKHSVKEGKKEGEYIKMCEEFMTEEEAIASYGDREDSYMPRVPFLRDISDGTTQEIGNDSR
jgi:hypothetical protein